MSALKAPHRPSSTRRALIHQRLHFPREISAPLPLACAVRRRCSASYCLPFKRVAAAAAPAPPQFHRLFSALISARSLTTPRRLPPPINHHGRRVLLPEAKPQGRQCSRHKSCRAHFAPIACPHLSRHIALLPLGLLLRPSRYPQPPFPNNSRH